MHDSPLIFICPGQGAQRPGMGRAWFDAVPAARQTFAAADEALTFDLGERTYRLSELCFDAERALLDRTDVCQPALYTCGVASYQGLIEQHGRLNVQAAAGLSLGEWTALHLAGVIGFIDGLKLIALRGRLMQEAAEQTAGSMVALIGADGDQAQAVCDEAAHGEVLVPSNFNAPGQIVLSGAMNACERAVDVAKSMKLNAKALQVAGAFHSPLMEPAAEGLKAALEDVEFNAPDFPVWSNVTGRPHDGDDLNSIKSRLVQQLVSPVRWSQCCTSMVQTLGEASNDENHSAPCWHELTPARVLKGLFRRIDRSIEVHTHDEPENLPATSEDETASHATH